MSDNIEERIKDAIRNKLKENNKIDEKTKEQIYKLFDEIDYNDNNAEEYDILKILFECHETVKCVPAPTPF